MMRVGSVGVMVILAAAAVWGCGDDDSGDKDAGVAPVPGSKALSKLTAAEVERLCAQLIVTVREASTPEQLCIEDALQTASTAAACESDSKACVAEKDYPDFDKARCKDFSGTSASMPKFDCSTTVAEVTACYGKNASWLEGLRCSQASKVPDPPECIADLNKGDCKFGLSTLIANTDDTRDAGPATAFQCKSSGKSYDYDFGGGDACNQCATTNCCTSYVDCENDADCGCFWDCLGQPGQRDCKADCGITEYPDAFTAHSSCLIDNCVTPCDLND